MKNARPYFSDGTITQTQRLENEKLKLKKLSKFNFFPKVIDSFIENNDYYLIETLSKGITINSYRAKDLPSYQNVLGITQSSINILKIIKDMCKKILLLHNADIFLGDISANNILINEQTNSVSFVDVEQTQFNVSKKKVHNFYRTRGFFDQQTNYLSPKQQDIQQLGYVIMAIFTRANDFLKIDTTGKTSFNFFDQFVKLYKIPEELAQIPYLLVKNPVESTLKRILGLRFSECKNIKIKNSQNCSNTFPTKLLEHLEKSYYCAIIDKFPTTLKLSSSIFTNANDVLFSNKILKIYFNVLYDSNTVLSESSIYKIKHALDNLYRDIEYHNEEKYKNIYLDKYLSVITILILKTDNINKKEYEVVLNYILKHFGVNKEGTYRFRPVSSSKYLVPYVSNGSAGVLIALLLYKKVTKDDNFDEIINGIAKSLSAMVLPKTASFADGLAGIIYALLLYQKIMSTNDFEQSIKQMINNLKLFTMNLFDNTYVITQDFSHCSYNFADGNLGLIFVLKMAKKQLSWKE